MKLVVYFEFFFVESNDVVWVVGVIFRGVWYKVG